LSAPVEYKVDTSNARQRGTPRSVILSNHKIELGLADKQASKSWELWNSQFFSPNFVDKNLFDPAVRL
jgi:hypothetical protein